MAYLITIQPSGKQFPAESGQTILEAASSAGLSLPHACRSGDCGACEGRILEGQVDFGNHQESLLTEDDKESGLALFCAAKPLTDLSIEAYEILDAEENPVQTLSCTVHTMERLSHDVMGIWLKLPAGDSLHFLPGQYIDILLEDGRRRSYSLANPPADNTPLELHVRRVTDGHFSEFVFNVLKPGDPLRIQGPYGTFHLHESDKPLILVAGGTGFAPIKSILSEAFRQGLRRDTTLYWGVRQARDMYMPDLPAQWERQHANFHHVPVLSEAGDDEDWQGRRGLVHHTVLEDHTDLSIYQVYACGAPAMIDAARLDFSSRGLPQEAFFSDAFTFQRDIATT